MSGLRHMLSHSLLTAYKLTLSPVFQLFGARCRHEPSCSEYAATCVARHGIWPGAWMALARLSRCRPGGSSGYDPAPLVKKSVPFWAPWRFGDWNRGERLVPELDPEPNDKDKD
ncbi:MAG: membrane protein insertion efficiency factor YidD [Pseudomonadota bacterium]